MRRLLPIFRAMLSEAHSDSPFCTVGVMIECRHRPSDPRRHHSRH